VTRLERLNARARAGRLTPHCYYMLVLRQVRRSQGQLAVELVALNVQINALLRKMRREQ
jgi:hypothetical protein